MTEKRFSLVTSRPDRFSTAIFVRNIVRNGEIRYFNDDFGNLSGLARGVTLLINDYQRIHSDCAVRQRNQRIDVKLGD